MSDESMDYSVNDLEYLYSTISKSKQKNRARCLKKLKLNLSGVADNE